MGLESVGREMQALKRLPIGVPFLPGRTRQRQSGIRPAGAMRFLAGQKYRNLRELAKETFDNNPKMERRYGSWAGMERHLQLPDQLSCSIDMATGTGKSYVLYGLAAILLAEGIVDRVLVLCPSNTIEDGLPKKDQTSALDKARCEGLRRMEAGECLEPASEVWRAMLHRIVPDPAATYRPRYETNAAWMKALHEMNAEKYKHLLAEWRETHKRRRNLWKHLASQGLPL